MNLVLIPIILIVSIALICGIVLVIAFVTMAVKEDQRFSTIRATLPGANCGACGYAGCDGYAKALVEGNEVRTNICIPGGSECSTTIADYLGLEADSVKGRVAVVFCGGDCTKTEPAMNYQGVRSCKAAKMIFGGAGSCAYGCLGNGDCAVVCPDHAITIDKGVAKVNRDLCTGCGLCARTCPQRIIAVLPERQKVYDCCSNLERGMAVKKNCQAGCIGCSKCKQVCAFDAITMKGTLAVIDPAKCTKCGVCVENCPTHCLILIDD